MSDKETGLSRVSSMREVQAILYEYREEDIQIPYLLAECVDYLIAERDRLREALERISAVTFTAGPEYGLMLARIAIEALQEDRDDEQRDSGKIARYE